MKKKKLNPFLNKPLFLRVCSTSCLKNTVGKGGVDFNFFPGNIKHIFKHAHVGHDSNFIMQMVYQLQ